MSIPNLPSREERRAEREAFHRSMNTPVLYLNSLVDLASAPGTRDKDRYAREVRSEIRTVLEQKEPPLALALVLEGCLRLTDRTQDIATTQKRLRACLDICSSLSGERWRRGQTVRHADEWVDRPAGHFANPTIGASMVAQGIISSYDPSRCICEVHPESICFAHIHTV